MLKIGTQNIAALRLGAQTVKKAYLGSAVVFSTEAAVTFSITAAVDPAGGGTVSGTGRYQKGQRVTLRAEPADGYRFSGWKEAGYIIDHDAEYTFTAAEDRALIAVFAVKPAPRLPDGYTEVHYIQSDGKSYIKTEKTPGTSASSIGQANTKIVMDVEPMEDASSTNKYFIYSTGTKNGISATTGIQWKTTNGAYVCIPTNNAGNISHVSAYAVANTSARRMRLELDLRNKTFSVDNEKVSITTRALFMILTGSYFYLFGPSGTSTTSKIIAKLYSFQIYQGTDLPLVCDFVPCIDPSGAVGLYDLAEGKFYANSGTGTFTAGPAV